jgi:hypothetical protein
MRRVLRALGVGDLPVQVASPKLDRLERVRLRSFVDFLQHQGRTASYPTAPSQIPACGTPAPGFSKLLASHPVFCLEVMTNAWFRQSEVFEQCLEARPRVTALLAAARFHDIRITTRS